MSCGCSNTTPIITTTNCGSCGYNCSNCTCPTNPIVEPAVVCADPEPCSELFPLECVIYTGPDIQCLGTANTLYPNVLHYLVLENSSTTARNFVSILNNINTQLCYLFSKDYISQLLTNIQNDETLSALFCSIASSCNCTCNITCGTLRTATYVSNTLPTIDTIDVNFTQVTGGSSITFSGTISGTTLTVTTPPGSGAIAIGQKITGTGITTNTFITAGSGTSWTLSQISTIASPITITAKHITYKVAIYKLISGSYYYINEQNTGFLFPTNTTATASISVLSANNNTENLPWLITVQATDQLADLPCTSGFYPEDIEQPVPQSNYDGCGFGLTIPVPTPTCYDFCLPACPSRSPIGSICNSYWGVNGSGQTTFTFTHNQPANTYPVLSYTFHWYLKLNNQNILAVQANDIYSYQFTASPDVVNVTSNGQTITGTLSDVYGVPQFNKYLLLITANSSNPNCVSPFQPRLEVPNNQYMGSEILNADACNWFIYASEKL